VRNGLDDISLVELFGWTKEEFDIRLAGSPIHRIRHEQWLRDLPVGLGNAPFSAGDECVARPPGGCFVPGTRARALGITIGMKRVFSP
jgi:epoxyqueuosine reductase QueG